MKEKKFYGAYARFAIRLLRCLFRPYHWSGQPQEGPVVYVGRHANLHGPFRTTLSSPIHFHPMVLHVFTDREACYKQYSEYTFTARYGKTGSLRKLAGWLASAIVVPLMRSLQAIPVYRDGFRSLSTIRIALRYLLSGESVIVWPDVNYTQTTGAVEEIYSGFLILGEMYLKQTGKSLPFVPVILDDDAKQITTDSAIYVNSYASDSERAARELSCAISK